MTMTGRWRVDHHFDGLFYPMCELERDDGSTGWVRWPTPRDNREAAERAAQEILEKGMEQ